MRSSHFILFSTLIVICASQRPSYAGIRPIGFPVIQSILPSAQNGSLGNRFNEAQNATTQRLPIEAQGNRELFNTLAQFPQDKQPFWFINHQALEEHRKQPQTYPQRPSIFATNVFKPAQTAESNQNSNQTNSNISESS